MTIREERVKSVPYRCPYCGSDTLSENPTNCWRVCLPCEVVFREPEFCETI